MKTEILVQLDGLHSGNDNTGVVVLAATNLPWALDPAFRRRFEPRIYIPLPDKAARRQLFEIHSGKWGEMLEERDLDELAEMTEGFSGSDVANVIKHALSVPLQKVQGAKWFKVVSSFRGLLLFLVLFVHPFRTIFFSSTWQYAVADMTICADDEFIWYRTVYPLRAARRGCYRDDVGESAQEQLVGTSSDGSGLQASASGPESQVVCGSGRASKVC